MSIQIQTQIKTPRRFKFIKCIHIYSKTDRLNITVCIPSNWLGVILAALLYIAQRPGNLENWSRNVWRVLERIWENNEDGVRTSVHNYHYVKNSVRQFPHSSVQNFMRDRPLFLYSNTWFLAHGVSHSSHTQSGHSSWKYFVALILWWKPCTALRVTKCRSS